MTQEELNEYIQIAQEMMGDALEHLDKELTKIRTGKASGSLLSGLLVPYYGAPTLLTQIANVATADSRTITVQPWEKNMLAPIERAIMEANLGITPQNDGSTIRLSIPPLTEERRRDLVKKAHHLGEDAKVGIRSARRDANDTIKKAVKDGFSEDAGKGLEAVVQDLTNKFSEKVDKQIEAKEKDIMTV